MKRLHALLGFLIVASQAFAGWIGTIAPIGDSLTEGAGENVRGAGYRVELQNRLNNWGLTFQYVGSLTAYNTPLYPNNPKHDGHGGWSTMDLVNGRNGEGTVRDWLSAYHPDKIILLIGQNDPWDWSDQYWKYKAVVDAIFEVCPNSLLYWSNVFAEEDHNNYTWTKCERCDQAIKALIPYYRAQGRRVVYMDAYHYLWQFSGIHDVYGTHLNNRGYDLLGAYYAGFLRKTPYLVVPRGGH